MFDLTGQIALITGASRGIGYAAAAALGRQGATVVLNARSREPLERAAGQLAAEGIDARALPFDMAQPAMACAAIDQLIESTGRIDIFLANAGIQQREELLDFPQDAFDRIIAVNLSAQWAVGRHVARSMVAAQYGRIIFTGSVTALLGRRDVTAYTAAKAALHGLTRQWAVELATHGVTVNAVAPGYIKTTLTQALWDDPDFNAWLRERVPQQRWGTPEDLAAAIVYLASRESGFMTGQILTIDGGLTTAL